MVFYTDVAAVISKSGHEKAALKFSELFRVHGTRFNVGGPKIA